MTTVFIIIGGIALILVFRVFIYNGNGEFEYRNYVENAQNHYNNTPPEYRGDLNILSKEQWLAMKSKQIARQQMIDELNEEIVQAQERGKVFPEEEIERRWNELDEKYPED